MKHGRIPWYLIVSMLVSGTAAVIASLLSIQSLSVWAGWEEWSAYLIPLTLDSLGGSCIAIWAMSNVDDDARRYARNVALLTIAVSAVLNALAHVVVSKDRGGWEVALIVGIAAIPPLALAGVIELAVKMRRPIAKVRRSQPRTDVPKVDEPKVAPPAEVPVDAPRSVPAPRAEVASTKSRSTATRVRSVTTRPRQSELEAEDAALVQVLTDARAERDRAWNASAVRRWLASPEGQAKLALAELELVNQPGTGRARKLAERAEEAFVARSNGHVVEA